MGKIGIRKRVIPKFSWRFWLKLENFTFLSCGLYWALDFGELRIRFFGIGGLTKAALGLIGEAFNLEGWGNFFPNLGTQGLHFGLILGERKAFFRNLKGLLI